MVSEQNMIAIKKFMGLIALLCLHGFAFGQNSSGGTAVKPDTVVVRSESICCKSDTCESDTACRNSCLSLQRLFFIKDRKQTKDINPNAWKMPKFDPYKKKFTDMQLIDIIGSHIKR